VETSDVGPTSKQEEAFGNYLGKKSGKAFDLFREKKYASLQWW
jgi:hypothetical protein